MLTKDVSAELEQALLKIQAQNKQPTVALVKAHLTTTIPMPAIITAIKRWKGNQSVPKVEVAINTEAGLEQRVTQLEQQLAILTERLAALEARNENMG